MAIIGVLHPVFDADGVNTGIVSISLPYASVAPNDYVDPVAPWQPTYLANLQSDASVLISSNPDIAPDLAIPGGISADRLAGLADSATFIDGPNGRRILSVVSVTRDLMLVSVWDRRNAGFWTMANSVAPYRLPILTWIPCDVFRRSFASAAVQPGNRTRGSALMADSKRGLFHESPHQGARTMLGLAVTFLIIAILAGVLGFGGMAGTSAGIAQTLFVVFLIFFVISLVRGAMSR
jgi:uncharacterized membrane protein YtjA (UPF0391 family)